MHNGKFSDLALGIGFSIFKAESTGRRQWNERQPVEFVKRELLANPIATAMVSRSKRAERTTPQRPVDFTTKYENGKLSNSHGNRILRITMPRRKIPILSRREKLLATLVSLQKDLDHLYFLEHRRQREPALPVFKKKAVPKMRLTPDLRTGKLGLISYPFLVSLIEELSSELKQSGTG